MKTAVRQGRIDKPCGCMPWRGGPCHEEAVGVVAVSAYEPVVVEKRGEGAAVFSANRAAGKGGEAKNKITNEGEFHDEPKLCAG